ETEEKIKNEIVEICTLINESKDDFTVKIIEKETKLEISYTKDRQIHIRRDHIFDKMTEEEIQQKILADCSRATSNKDGFFVKIVDLDYGMKDENPVSKLNVYTKHKPDEANQFPKEETSRILAPYIFKEQLVRIYLFDRSLQVSDGLSIAWHIWFDRRADLQEESEEKPAEEQKAQSKH
ncbi:unnamed protein product, partial [Candidula unifasciata]